jgi:hypothetical protein
MSTYVKQEGGAHYQGADQQHWDIMEAHDIGYLEGCASKYPLRWRKKGGIEDLRKALSYVEKVTKCRPQQGARRLVPQGVLNRLYEASGTGKRERDIISHILASGSHEDFLCAAMKLRQLIAENE